MICRHKTVKDIESSLGARATVSRPTWSHHDYSCAYRFSGGRMTLAVKELSSWPETLDYFHALQRPGRWRRLYGLGQGAAQSPDGTVVVRKDWKVLTVDVSGLPSRIGHPASTPTETADTVAGAIMLCWHGD